MAAESQSILSDVHRTAFYAAAMRAAHHYAGAEPKIFRDAFAAGLCEMTEEEAIAFNAKIGPVSATTCILRSRYTEDRLALARARLSQYVVLGAGLDSYALRMGDNLGDMIVFEIDEPPFQAWKQQRIQALGLTVPQQLRFAPCDFERTSIAEALAESGFDENAPCFISWLGVTQYLTRPAIMETLRWAGARPAGSEIVLTFLEDNAQAAAFKKETSTTSMLMQSYFSVEAISQMLREAGFNQVEHFSPDQANAAYFQGRPDGLRAPQIQRLVSAII
jgi:methyltransferase (TIGR00027 family)